MSLALLTELANQQAYKDKSTGRNPGCIYITADMQRGSRDCETCIDSNQYYSTLEVLR